MSDPTARVKVCVTQDCGRTGKLTRGMCNRCYKRWRVATPPNERGLPPLAARVFWDYVEKTHEHGCWLWTGKVDRRGYGRWAGGGVKEQASRHSWALANGPIPDGFWVLHYCDTPPCVNPRHLYLGTYVENMIDMKARGRAYRQDAKTHCPRDHALVDPNVRYSVTAYGGVHRSCRTCDNDRKREDERQKRARERVEPPRSLISTDDAMKKHGIGRSTLPSWQRAGLITSQRYGLKAYWDASEVDRLVQESPRLRRKAS